MHRRRAKIAATLGPACDDRKTLERLSAAGMDIVRINFSHGVAEDHERRVRRARAAAKRMGRPLTVMADLQGPRFRVGALPQGPVPVEVGQSVRLIAGKERGDGSFIPVSYAALARDVRRGSTVLIDDGRIELSVTRVRGDVVHAEVVRGGSIGERKGINLPGDKLSVPPLMPKDKRDLKTAVAIGADWLAVSFVRHPDDIAVVRRLLQRAGSQMPVMAKIERPEALEHIDGILEASDGLLVARGDLGVELPPERVPLIQKDLIERCTRSGKPVMTATQMLDSMRHDPRPTRAEASDVANAVLDGSSSLLLTAETAVGEYPVEAVGMMDRIIRESERSPRRFSPDLPRGELSVPVATSLAACRAAYDVGAKYIVVFTQSGFSALQCGRFRPSTPILAFTPQAQVARRLNMLWGIEPTQFKLRKSIEQMIRGLDNELLKRGMVERGDAIVVVMGTPIGVGGTTNLLEVRRVGISPAGRKIVASSSASSGTRTGKARRHVPGRGRV